MMIGRIGRHSFGCRRITIAQLTNKSWQNDPRSRTRSISGAPGSRIGALHGSKDSESKAAGLSAPTGLQVRLRFDEQNGVNVREFGAGSKDFAKCHGNRKSGDLGRGDSTMAYMRMDTTTRIDLPGAGDVEGKQPFTVAFWMRPDLAAA